MLRRIHWKTMQLCSEELSKTIKTPSQKPVENIAGCTKRNLLQWFLGSNIYIESSRSASGQIQDNYYISGWLSQTKPYSNQTNNEV